MQSGGGLVPASSSSGTTTELYLQLVGFQLPYFFQSNKCDLRPSTGLDRTAALQKLMPIATGLFVFALFGVGEDEPDSSDA